MLTIQAVFIFIGLSLDSFVLMMKKGSTLKSLTMSDACRYAGVFSLSNTAALITGYMLAFAAENKIPEYMKITLACQIILIAGLILIVRMMKIKPTEEKLDRDFTMKKCLGISTITSIDTFTVGAALNLFDISLSTGIILSMIIPFILVNIGTRIGYKYGTVAEKPIGVSGGFLMVGLSGYLMMIYLFHHMV